MVRIDAIWLATEPMDMRAGTETALARGRRVRWGAVALCLVVYQPPHRLYQGKFFWPGSRHGFQMELGDEKLHVLVLGLPWQRVGSGSVISIIKGEPKEFGKIVR